MTGGLLGLLGGALIGTSDAFARVTGRKLPILLLTTALFTLSLGPIALYMALADAWPVYHAEAWRQTAWSGLFTALGLALLFAAIARGPVSVASPIMSSSTILVIGLNASGGEPLLTGHIVGAALSFGAIFALALPERSIQGGGPAENPREIAVTALLAFAASIVLALRVYTAQEATESIGPLGVTAISRAVAGLCTGTVYLAWIASGRRFAPSGAPEIRRHPPIWLLVLAQSALETCAIFTFLIGGAGEEGDRIAAVIGFASFAAFSPLVARIIWGEKISNRRTICIVVTIIGVAVASSAALW